jgi:hypothetical protein
MVRTQGENNKPAGCSASGAYAPGPDYEQEEVATTAVPSEYTANSTWLMGCNAIQVWSEEHGKVQPQSFKMEYGFHHVVWEVERSYLQGGLLVA